MRGIMLVVWLILVPLLTAETVHAEVLNVCQQDIAYTIAEPAPDVSPDLRAFSGVWIGNWNRFPFAGATKTSSPVCAGLIVERIDQDGTARTIYFRGANPDWQLSNPRMVRWKGKISSGLLNLPRDFSGGDYMDYKLKSPSELAGTLRGLTTGSFTKR